MEYFETVKCDDYEVFNLDYHNRRIANTIGLNINLQEYIYAPSSELFRCKVIYDESGILSVDYFVYKKREIKSFKLIYDDKIEYSKKYLSRNKLDELYSKKDKEDEIIIVKNGFITDTSIANIAVLYENRWLTPKKALLEGTTKQRYLDTKELYEFDITVEMLKKSSKIALLNAMIDFDILDEFYVLE